MSFLTDPNLYDVDLINDPDLLCHTATTTPVILILSLSDIQIGDAWLPGDAPPPNGTWNLIHQSESVWQLITPDYQFRRGGEFDGSTLFVETLGGYLIFNGFSFFPCSKQFNNGFTSPSGRKYYGGSAVLNNPLATGPNTIQSQMELININPFGENWCKSTLSAPNQTTNRFSRRIGKDNILIQYDLT